jgi:FtsH-binding integral membrane protein
VKWGFIASWLFWIYSFRVTDQNQTYPVIKSPVLRKTAEYMAGALLIATIILGLTASEAATMVSLGVFLMVAAFAVSGIRGGLAFSSPYLPMRKAGRIAMFSIGVLSLVLGAIRLLHL